MKTTCIRTAYLGILLGSLALASTAECGEEIKSPPSEKQSLPKAGLPANAFDLDVKMDLTPSVAPPANVPIRRDPTLPFLGLSVSKPFDYRK